MEDQRTVGAAARNNAEWCHVFCEAHQIRGVFEESRWFSPSRTPPLYPDVVTLQPGLSAQQALAGTESGRGSSVKDSFNELDLDDAGFRVLFTAEWIVAWNPGSSDSADWRAITSDDALAEWEAAWDDDPGDERFFPSSLLAEPDVVFLAHYDGGQISAGVIAGRSAGVVGLGNVFATGMDLDVAYAAAGAAAAKLWPGLPVVGYEHGEPLAAAHAAGFQSIGPLRIWTA